MKRNYLWALLLALIISAGCSDNNVKKEKSENNNDSISATASVDSKKEPAESDVREYPWEEYSPDEIYDVANSDEGPVFTIEDASAIEDEFISKYENEELTSDWGKYLHVFGGELSAKYPDDKDYFKLMMDAGVATMNEQYDYAKGLIEKAKNLRTK